MKPACGRLAIFAILPVATIGSAQQPSDFDGTWVMKSNGQAILKFTITAGSGGIAGSLTAPGKFTIDQDGNVTNMGEGQRESPIQAAELKEGRLELKINGDALVMTLDGTDRALLKMAEMDFMRPWRLERVSNPAAVSLASSLPTADYPPDIQALRQQLRAMVQEDQAVRLAFDLTRMDGIDARNRPELLRIFDRYGWVTNSLAGSDAAHDYWLLIQHQTPEIQRRLLPALEKAAKAGDASMADYAYLYDRVQMGLGKPQHWGSQTQCEDGKPALYEVDDRAGLDERRKELFLQPVGEYLNMDYLVQFCVQAGKQPVR